jgi:clan AA aspartic protease (TIGR02281 family)
MHHPSVCRKYFMFSLPFWCAAILLLLAAPTMVSAGYLDENPDEVFKGVYDKLGVDVPPSVARDPVVWTYLSELKREPCDQTSINNLGIALDRLGYRREAAESLYNFVLACHEPVEALNRSVNIYLKLSDYAKAAEVANEYVRRVPQNSTAHYLRATALQESGDVEKSLSDYADTIELFGTDKTKISSVVFVRMARAYATLGRFCEASTAILTWVAYDPVHRDNSQSQRLISDYDQKGNCKVTTDQVKQRYPIAKRGAVITVKAEINGVKGNFILDTGATFVTIKSTFNDKAKIPVGDAREITILTANGPAKGLLSRADRVMLGGLAATNVPVVVQKTDERSYGVAIDGLLGMSFLSRFEVQLSDAFVEVRTRGRK